MRVLGLMFVAALAVAQPQEELSANGVLLERDAPDEAGQLAIRTFGDRVLRFRFDARTLVQIGGKDARVAALNPGDRVSLQTAASTDLIPFAVAVRVLTPAPPRSSAAPQPYPWPGPRDLGMPPGIYFDEAFTGSIARMDGSSLDLQMTDGRRRRFLFRSDTSYIQDGRFVDSSALKTHMRVTLRAGPSPGGRYEIVKVIWGSILRPE